MSERHQYFAYIATLVALVILVAIGAWLASIGKLTEACGVAAAVAGLLGAIHLPVNHPESRGTTPIDSGEPPS